jgi:hypothetical protein
MSCLWHWMKRLKWAGYRHNQKGLLGPEPESLALFCLACPQVGINNGMIFRFVFKCIFVADGNFKANHVQQKNSNTDV